MYQKAKLDTAGIPGLVEKYKGALKFQMTDTPYFLYTDRKNKNKDCGAMMDMAKELLDGLAALRGDA